MVFLLEATPDGVNETMLSKYTSRKFACQEHQAQWALEVAGTSEEGNRFGRSHIGGCRSYMQ
jgi:hypothetical protein